MSESKKSSKKAPAKKSVAKKASAAKSAVGAKGKATPKRKVAESKLKVNAIASNNKAENKRLDKNASRAARMAAREAYMRGDENALPARDRGPARRFVRDYIDSRRTIGEYFLPMIMVVLVMSVVFPGSLLSVVVMYSIMLYSIVTGFFISRAVKREVLERFPGTSTKGLGMYAWLRSTQMRRLRAPGPRVKRGDKI